MSIKKELKEKFTELYPDKRLLGIKLDGFSHNVWFDSGNVNDPIEQETFSGCMPELHSPDRVKTLLGKYPHHKYQGNYAGYVYVTPEER